MVESGYIFHPARPLSRAAEALRSIARSRTPIVAVLTIASAISLAATYDAGPAYELNPIARWLWAAWGFGALVWGRAIVVGLFWLYLRACERIPANKDWNVAVSRLFGWLAASVWWLAALNDAIMTVVLRLM